MKIEINGDKFDFLLFKTESTVMNLTTHLMVAKFTLVNLTSYLMTAESTAVNLNFIMKTKPTMVILIFIS